MLKKTILGIAAGAMFGVAALAATSPSAQAGVRVYLNPVPYNAYGYSYHPNYTHEYSPRCYWKRRKVRYKKCWVNSYGRHKCRWKRRWRKVKVCD